MNRSLDIIWQAIPSPPLLMGIVNVTPDSFSDGGRYERHEMAVAHALRLVREGADIIDIGGESTRPPGNDYGGGSRGIPVDEELGRVTPVIETLRREHPALPISIDTMKPEVAREAIRAGATIINDVSAGTYDEGIWEVAAANDVPYILMHGHDPAARRPVDEIVYDDVVEDVFAFLRERTERATAAGIRRVIADVGIGFSKRAADSARLIREHRRFLDLGVPMLVGASRKSFIGRMLGGIPPEERLHGTLAAHGAAALNGAAIIRTHDIRPAYEFFAVFSHLTADPRIPAPNASV